jgi:glycosyltransferase involved in cell wall biosynthesis
MPDLSVIIPSRNEVYLVKTMEDILSKAEGNIEIIAILDGYKLENPIEDSRIVYLHIGQAKGMRNAINSGVAIAKSKYLMKCDAHCLFDRGFDLKLSADYQPDWVVVPRRKRLDEASWSTSDQKPDIDYEYLSYPNITGNWSDGLHGRPWNARAQERAKIPIDDNMSAQGSCWFMSKDYYHKLELEDEENYGTFSHEFQEIGLKCWLSGGKVMSNKKTWYAHLHKGRGYSLGSTVINKGTMYTNRWLTNSAWDKQTLPFSWLIEHFWPVPGWPQDRKLWTP